MNPHIKIGSIVVELADYAVGASAVLGIRDSGKTVTSKGIAEQLIENNVPIIVFDAVGRWRWLKTAGEGSHSKAFKVVVAGGREPDLPLTPHSVPEIVRSALKERIPLVIDLFDKNLSKSDWRRIVQQAIHIIHYENEGGAFHVFLEEAAEFVPQRVIDGETYAEVEKLVRMGGNASVGITLINQRSQEINKAVLDNCSTALVLGCQVGKNAIEAVEKWIERLDSRTAKELTESLPRLKSGQAWVWTRKSLDHPTLEQMPMCRSFHPDRRTPEAVLNSLRPANIDEFVARMARSIPKVIEEAKARDPKALQSKVLELERKLAQAEKSKPSTPAKIRHEPALTDAERKRLTVLIESYERMATVGDRIEAMAAEIKQSSATNRAEMTFFKTLLAGKLTPEPFIHTSRNNVVRQVIHQSRQPNPKPPEIGALGRCERAILNVLCQYPSRSVDQIAVITGYSGNSGGFNNSLSRLRSSGLITRGNPVQVTEKGRNAAGDVQPLPEGAALVDYWCAKLGKCEREVLRFVFDQAPQSFTSEQIGEATGYSSNSGGFNNALSRLRTLELITRGQPIKASDHLFQ